MEYQQPGSRNSSCVLTYVVLNKVPKRKLLSCMRNILKTSLTLEAMLFTTCGLLSVVVVMLFGPIK